MQFKQTVGQAFLGARVMDPGHSTHDRQHGESVHERATQLKTWAYFGVCAHTQNAQTSAFVTNRFWQSKGLHARVGRAFAGKASPFDPGDIGDVAGSHRKAFVTTRLI